MIAKLEPHEGRLALLMDRAYEDLETRRVAVRHGLIPVVPPNPQRRQPWEYDKAIYRQRRARAVR